MLNGHCSQPAAFSQGSFSCAVNSSPAATSSSSSENRGTNRSPLAGAKQRIVTSPSMPLSQLKSASSRPLLNADVSASTSSAMPFGVPRWASRSGSLTGSISLSSEHFRHPDLRRDSIPSIPRVGPQCHGTHMCLTCALNVVAAAVSTSAVPLPAPIEHPDMMMAALPSPTPPSTPTDENELRVRVEEMEMEVESSPSDRRSSSDSVPLHRARQQRAGSSTAVLGGAHIHSQTTANAAAGPTPVISVTAAAPNETAVDSAPNAAPLQSNDLLQNAGTHLNVAFNFLQFNTSTSTAFSASLHSTPHHSTRRTSLTSFLTSSTSTAVPYRIVLHCIPIGSARLALGWIGSDRQVSRVRADPAAAEQAVEVLEDLDWCLEQLEAVQTHRSLSELASSKVRRLASPLLSFPRVPRAALRDSDETSDATHSEHNPIRSRGLSPPFHSISVHSIPFGFGSDTHAGNDMISLSVGLRNT